MNFRQKRMLVIVAIAMGMVVLWPPVNVRVTPSFIELQYVGLFSGYDGNIHFLLLIAECLALCLLGLLCYRSLDDKTDDESGIKDYTHGRNSS